MIKKSASLVFLGLIFLLWYFSLSIPTFGVALDGEIHEETLKKLESLLKKPLSFVVFFVQWSYLESSFPKQTLEAIWQTNAIPCLTWELMTVDKGKEEMISKEAILNGSWDAYLRFFAQELKKTNKTVIIRLAHEMNLKRYHWTTTYEQFGPSTPLDYQAVFRYIVSIFRKEGASRVLFAFCPNVDSVPALPWNVASHYYPGDDVVDILGMDGYNFGEGWQEGPPPWLSHWKSFETIFTPLYKELKQLSPKKPLLVFETASVNGKESKKVWLEQAFQTAKKWGLEGIIWFEVNKEQDWRLETSLAEPLEARDKSA